MTDVLLAYASTARVPFETDALVTLLARARTNNKVLGITGMLLHVEGAFFQVLEGPSEAVDRLYLVIQADPRHVNVAKLISEPIEARTFGDWSMGLAEASRAELTANPELNDFFRNSSRLMGFQEGRARSLLEAFRAGRWRRRVKE